MKKEIIRNLYFVRRTNNYNEYKAAGGTGTKNDYRALLIKQQNKTNQVEKLMTEIYE